MVIGTRDGKCPVRLMESDVPSGIWKRDTTQAVYV
jgi:hypothetical protein